MRIKGKLVRNCSAPRWRRRAAFTGTISALILATAAIFSQAQQSGKTATAGAPQHGTQERDINAMLSNYELPGLDLKEVAREARATGRVALQLKGVKYDLELEPNNLLAPGFRAVITTDNGEMEEARTEVNTYRGRVAGEEQSDVRLLIQGDLMSGYIRAKDGWLFIDPLGKYQRGARPGQVVVYRDADVRPEARGTCGLEGLERQSEKLLKGSRKPEAAAVATAPATAAAVTSSPRIVEIATDADYEFSRLYGGVGVNTLIQAIINQVDGIYRRELNLTLRITFQNVYATSSDPYNKTFGPGQGFLDEFVDFWNANRTDVVRDVAHLFTNRRPIDVAGIATFGSVCNDPTGAYSLSVGAGLGFARLVAHEIGHTFGAVHDPYDLCDNSGPIMCRYGQPHGTDTFSQASKDAIATHLNNTGDCLGERSRIWVGISDGVGSFNATEWGREDTSASMKNFTGDFNGDGKTDVLKIDASKNCKGGLWVGLSDGNRFNFSRWATWCTSADIKVLTGDFNGDGRTDVMKFDPSDTCNGSAWVGLSNGVDAFNTEQWGSNLCTPADIKVFAGDFNNDGRTDVLKIDPSDNCTGELLVGISTGSGFNTTRWATWCTSINIKVLTGDFNGDGRTDVMKFDPSDACNGALWVGLSNGVNAFNTSQWGTLCTPATIKVFAGDFNGDGKTDVMKIDESDNCTGALLVGISNGVSAFNTSQWGSWCTPYNIKALAGDFDGNGKTDVMKFAQADNCLGALWTGLSNGVSAFDKMGSGQWAAWCTPASIKVMAGDFNGDGKSDVMKFDLPYVP